jgi:broad specificity phosphatase PhoE
MKLILIRHGETIENIRGILQGHLPGKLSKNGIEQAKRLALRLEKEKIDAIYSSDLARAADTAKEIAKFHQGIPIKFAKELRERNLKEDSGKKKEERQFSSDSDHYESGESMKKRAKKILDKAYKKYSKGTVLFVAHNGINNMLLRIILHKQDDKWENLKNTSVSIFEINEDKNNKIHLLNCVKHLEKNYSTHS